MTNKILTLRVDPFYFGPFPEMIEPSIREPRRIPVPKEIPDFNAWMNSTIKENVGHVRGTNYPHEDNFSDFSGDRGYFWGEYPEPTEGAQKEIDHTDEDTLTIRVLVKWLWSID